MGLDSLIRSLEKGADGLGSCIDRLVGFASEHPLVPGIASGLAAIPVTYKLLESSAAYLLRVLNYAPDSVYESGAYTPLVLASLYSGFMAGVISYMNFRDEQSIRKIGVCKSAIQASSRSLLKASSEKNFWLKLWNSPFEHPWSWAVIPGMVAISGYEQSIIGSSGVYLLSAVLLKVASPILHSDTLAPWIRSFYVKHVKHLDNHSDGYLHELEKVAGRWPSVKSNLNLLRAYSERGMTEEAVDCAKKLTDGRIAMLKYRRIPFVNDPINATLADYCRQITKGNAAQSTYLYLAALLHEVQPEKARFIIDEMTYRFGSVEDSLLAFWFLREKEPELAKRHLAVALAGIYQNPEKYRREPIGDAEPSNHVFRFSGRVLRDDFVVKAGHDEYAVNFEAGVTRMLREKLSGLHQYAFPEPLFAGPVGAEYVYLMSQLHGETLAHNLRSGKDCFDLVLASWELTRRIHELVGSGVSRYGFVPVGSRVREAAYRSNLDFPERVRKHVANISVPVEYFLDGSQCVFNTDCHSENRLVVQNGGFSIGAVDLEDKGEVYLEEEAAGLFRYVPSGSLMEKEDLFLRDAGIEPVRYYNAALVRDVRLIAAWWNNPNRPSMSVRATERIEDAVGAIAQIKEMFPASFSRFSQYGKAADALREMSSIIMDSRNRS